MRNINFNTKDDQQQEPNIKDEAERNEVAVSPSPSSNSFGLQVINKFLQDAFEVLFPNFSDDPDARMAFRSAASFLVLHLVPPDQLRVIHKQEHSEERNAQAKILSDCFLHRYAQVLWDMSTEEVWKVHGSDRLQFVELYFLLLLLSEDADFLGAEENGAMRKLAEELKNLRNDTEEGVERHRCLFERVGCLASFDTAEMLSNHILELHLKEG